MCNNCFYILPDFLSPNPHPLHLSASLHHGQPRGGPDVLRVLLSVLRPTSPALFTHFLQDLPGQPPPGVD